MLKNFLVIFLISAVITPLGLAAEGLPSLATGLKTGEVTSNSAIIWARLCGVEAAAPTSVIAAAPGAPGKVQISYWPSDRKKEITKLQPVSVDAERDFTCQIKIKNLLPDTLYIVEATVFSQSGSKGRGLTARFKTAPAVNQATNFDFIVVTCQGHETVDDLRKGHWVYSHMLTHNPDFFIHTGDIVYYDKNKAQPFSKTVAAARQRWNRMFSYQWNRDFHTKVSSFFMKDDHDTLKNDCWPGQKYGKITWEQGVALFKEQTPQGAFPYRRVRWGKDLELWLMEGRDFRSPNHAPDGPDKTILGEVQKAWLKRTLKASDATFKLVVFPSPVVGPDKAGKKDNHSNPNFRYEGRELRKFLASMPNTYVVCGDRHWQYASKDPVTGLVEICCGPINNAHALRGGNANQDKKYHLYYGGGRGGYLRVAVNRDGKLPKISFIWHGDRSSKGAINHQLTFQAMPKG